jgi:hypothetical protein
MSLELLDIKSPCRVPWSSMQGDDRVRACAKCEKNVYDLSALTRAEAEALLARAEGTLCLRFYRRADGTVVTSDCSRHSIGWRMTQAAAAMLFLAGGMFGFVRLHAATLDASTPAPTPVTKSPGTALQEWVDESWKAAPTPQVNMIQGGITANPQYLNPTPTPTPAVKKHVIKKKTPPAPKGNP